MIQLSRHMPITMQSWFFLDLVKAYFGVLEKAMARSMANIATSQLGMALRPLVTQVSTLHTAVELFSKFEFVMADMMLMIKQNTLNEVQVFVVDADRGVCEYFACEYQVRERVCDEADANDAIAHKIESRGILTTLYLFVHFFFYIMRKYVILQISYINH